MLTKNIKIDKDLYTVTAVDADISGAIGIELISDFLPLVVSFFDRNTEVLNNEIRKSVDSKKLMRIFKELINVDVLKKNNELVLDWKEEFSCKPLTFYRLGYEALRFNCEDFFTFISGFVKEKLNGQDWKKVMDEMVKSGVEIDPMFSALLQNGNQKQEEVQNQ